jgi:dihydrodipicolinate synthase/N-acetylneuraminate lyase
MREKSAQTPPRVAATWPCSDVPAPKGTIGRPWAVQAAAIAATSALPMGNATISALTAAVPGAGVKLWNAVQSKDHDRALAIHHSLNRLWNTLPHDYLPACVKYIQHRQGLGFFHPRAPMDEVGPAQKKLIDAALAGVDA